MRLVEKISLGLWVMAFCVLGVFLSIPLSWREAPLPLGIMLLAVGIAFVFSFIAFYSQIRFRQFTELSLQKREMGLELMRNIAFLANETSSSDVVVRSFLSKMAQLFNFEVGHVYRQSEDGENMVSTGIWFDTDNRRYQQFRMDRQALKFPKGDGLPGTVWASGKPDWRGDLWKDKDCPRRKILHECGLQSAVAFPITAHGELEAVVEFFASDKREEDRFLLELMEQLGQQIGLAFARERTTTALLESEERFRRLAAAASEGVLVHKKGVILEVNRAASVQLGYNSEELVGRQTFDLIAPEHRDSQRLSVADGDESVYEMDLIRKDGSRFPAEIFGKNIELDGCSARVALFRDITNTKQVEHAIRASEERFKRLAEATCEAVVIHHDLKIREVNRAFLDLFGFQKVEDVIGQNLMDLISPSSRDAAMSCIVRASRTGEEVKVETSIGETRVVELRSKGLLDDASARTASVVTLLDVTDRKVNTEKLHEAEARSGIVLDQVPACLWSVDLDFIITSSAGSGLKGLGVRPGELIGLSLFQYLGTSDPSLPSIVAHRRALGGETVRFENTWVGRTFRTHLEPLKGPDGKIVGAVGVAMDLTAEKQAEDRLRAAANELLRSNRELEQFAYVASHDLQEPLRMITSYIELLGQRYKGKLDNDADTFIRFAVEGAKRMKLQIDDLLLYSRVHRSGAEFAGVESKTALQRACDNLRLLVDEAGVELKIGDMPRIRGDESQIVLLFQNLIGNAIKFRRSDVPSQIEVRVDSHEGEWIFVVEDNGIGIDMKYSDRIFNIFQRLHSVTDYPGTGIGLAICKKIVERHGGRIWVESQPGSGARFKFALPASPWEVLPGLTTLPANSSARTGTA